jgi:predicted DNA-binding protein (MmcQ/YjbR family)
MSDRVFQEGQSEENCSPWGKRWKDRVVRVDSCKAFS